MSAGSTSAMTSSMPDLGRDRPRRWRRCRRSAAPAAARARELGDGLGARRLDAVGDGEQAARGAVPADGDDGPARSPAPRASAVCELGAAGLAQSASRLGRPTTTACPSTTPSTPRPSRLRNDSTARRARRPRSRPRCAMARAIGCSEASSSAPARRSSSRRSPPSATIDVAHLHPAGRDRAGLVEHDRVDAARRLEHLGALDQDAELGAAAGADEQRRRRGESERARAGDDQHGDRRGEREGRRSRRRRARSRASRRRARSRSARRSPRRGRRAAGPAPCPSAPRSRAGRSGPARCRPRPAWRARRGDRRR